MAKKKTIKGISYDEMKLLPKEVIKGFLMGFTVSGLVCLIFYRNLIASLIVGTFCGIIFLTPYKEYLIKKRRKELLLEFKDFMESLATSYSAGGNIQRAFIDSREDMERIYGEKSMMVRELDIILAGIRNGNTIEVLLYDFASRSGLEDVASFADVFYISQRSGGDTRRILYETRNVICDKIDMEEEMKTFLNQGKQELNIMILMPVLIVLVTSTDSSMSIASNTPVNLIVKTVALILFGIAYMWGKRLTDVEI